MKPLTDLEKDILRIFHFEGVSMSAIEIANSIKHDDDGLQVEKNELHKSFIRLKNLGYIIQDNLLDLEDGISKYCLSDAGMLKCNHLKTNEPTEESVFEGVDKNEIVTEGYHQEPSKEVLTSNETSPEYTENTRNRTDLDIVNNALFEQMKRLGNDNLSPERMVIEVSRAKATASVAKSITENIKVEVEVNRMKKEGTIEHLPKMMRVTEET